MLALASGGQAHAQEWDANPQESDGPPPAEPVHEAPAAAAPSPGGGVDWELGGEAAYLSAPIHGGTNPFGAGFGGRVGLTFRDVYVGATIVDFLGGSDVDVSYRALLYGVQLGYGVRLPLTPGATLTLRPMIGLGAASVSYTDPSLAVDVVTTASGSSSSSGSDTISVSALYLQPELLAMVRSGVHFVAVGASMLEIPNITYGGAGAAEWRSYGVHAQLGFVF